MDHAWRVGLGLTLSTGSVWAMTQLLPPDSPYVPILWFGLWAIFALGLVIAFWGRLAKCIAPFSQSVEAPNRRQPSSTTDQIIFFEWRFDRRPIIVPNDGVVHIVQLNTPTSVVMAALHSTPGTECVPWRGWETGITNRRCEIRNYTGSPILNCHLVFRVEFFKAVELGEGRTETGGYLGGCDVDVHIERLEPGAGAPFVFYVGNTSGHFVYVTPPRELKAEASNFPLAQGPSSQMTFSPRRKES